MNAQVTPIVFINYKDEKSYHVKIEVGDKKHFINVGEKTFNAVLDLISPKPEKGEVKNANNKTLDK